MMEFSVALMLLTFRDAGGILSIYIDFVRLAWLAAALSCFLFLR